MDNFYYFGDFIKTPIQQVFDSVSRIINDKNCEKIIETQDQLIWGNAILHFLIKRAEQNGIRKYTNMSMLVLPGINHGDKYALPQKYFYYCEYGLFGVLKFSIKIIEGEKPSEYRYRIYEKTPGRLYEIMNEYINSLYIVQNNLILFPKFVFDKQWIYQPEKIPFYKSIQLLPRKQEEICDYLIDNIHQPNAIFISGILGNRKKHFVPMIILRKIHRIVYYIPPNFSDSNLITVFKKIPHRNKIIIFEDLDKHYEGKNDEMEKIILQILDINTGDNIIIFTAETPNNFPSIVFGLGKIQQKYDFSQI